MQAVVLLQVAGDPSKIEPILERLKYDADFIGSTHTIIESAQVAFGTANFFLVLRGMSNEEIFRAIGRLRQEINRVVAGCQAGTVGVSTSTILGWDPGTETTLGGVVQRVCEEVLQRADLKIADGQLGDLIGRFTVDSCIRERLAELSKLLAAVDKIGLTRTDYGPLRTAIAKHLASK